MSSSDKPPLDREAKLKAILAERDRANKVRAIIEAKRKAEAEAAAAAAQPQAVTEAAFTQPIGEPSGTAGAGSTAERESKRSHVLRDGGRSNQAVNLAQKIAIAVTLLAVAVFLFLQAGREYSSRDGMALVIQAEYGRTLWYTTVLDVAGIVLIGGAVTVLLGIKKRKRPDAGE
jgi:hypothetical protein